MKKYILASLIFAANAHAVSVTADSGGFSQVIVNSANVPINVNEGFISVGFFETFNATTDFSVLSGADLQADFQSFGAAFTFGGTGFPGFYSAAVDGGRVGAASPFLGKTLVTLIWNSANLADATEALAYRHNVTFPNDDGAPAPASLTAVPGDAGGAYLFGGPTGGTGSVSGIDIPAVSLAVLIPEPSTLLLSAFGALALLRRKR